MKLWKPSSKITKNSNLFKFENILLKKNINVQIFEKEKEN